MALRPIVASFFIILSKPKFFSIVFKSITIKLFDIFISWNCEVILSKSSSIFLSRVGCSPNSFPKKTYFGELLNTFIGATLLYKIVCFSLLPISTSKALIDDIRNSSIFICSTSSLFKIVSICNKSSGISSMSYK